MPPPPPPEEEEEEDRCLVYSVGCDKDTLFEAAVVSELGCASPLKPFLGRFLLARVIGADGASASTANPEPRGICWRVSALAASLPSEYGSLRKPFLGRFLARVADPSPSRI